jgi:hypothetical protein
VTRVSWGEKLDSCLEVVISSNILRKFFAIYLSVCASDLFEFEEQTALGDKTFASIFKGPVLSDLGTGSDNKVIREGFTDEHSVEWLFLLSRFL